MSYSSEEIDDEQLAVLDDLEMLRDDLASELQIINQYHGHVLVVEKRSRDYTGTHY